MKVMTRKKLLIQAVSMGLAMAAASPALASDRVKMFIGDLSSNVGEVRSGAALALGEAGDHRAVKPLQKLLNDEYMDARKSAAWALGELGDKTAAAPLAKVLEHDSAAQVRVAAAGSLGKLRVETTADSLSKALGDQDYSVRAASVEALASVEGDKAATDAKKLLTDENWSVRCSALNALGSIKDPTAIGQIATLLGSDESEFVRAGAAHALGRIGVADRAAIAALEKAMEKDTDKVRGEAAVALNALGVTDSDTGYKAATQPDTTTPPVTKDDHAVEL
jgi:HEAT repeat protein